MVVDDGLPCAEEAAATLKIGCGCPLISKKTHQTIQLISQTYPCSKYNNLFSTSLQNKCKHMRVYELAYIFKEYFCTKY